jgi:ankyrin repeat protein
MLLDAGLEPTSKNDEGSFPLHFAAMRGDTEMVQLLLSVESTVQVGREQSDLTLQKGNRAIYVCAGSGFVHACVFVCMRRRRRKGWCCHRLRRMTIRGAEDDNTQHLHLDSDGMRL